MLSFAMMFEDDELIKEFVVESCAHLSEIEGQLLEIESAGAQCDIDLVNTVFRAVHSVKGAAGFLGLTVVNSLAHSLENVLNKIRNRELVPNRSIVSVLLNAADQLSHLIENVATSNEIDVRDVLAELDSIDTGLERADEPVTHDAGSTETCAEVIQTGTKSDLAPSQASLDTDRSVSRHRIVDANVRVNVTVLDRLMNLAGELVLSRNQLIAAVGNHQHDGLDTIADRVDQVTSELQETIMQTRMQPIGVVFGRFPRVVRDLSRKLGKDCLLEIEGDDVEVDKTIVEALGDPLTHLVRNSVDHGIEMPLARQSAGKPVSGHVRLRAYHQAGKVCIRIEDDGAGMDPARIRSKAIEKGIISLDQSTLLTDNEILRLIFAPGFSTAAQVTDVSGRGVGMDVVRTNIEQLGGTVDVESSLGHGSAIHITLPLTLAIVPSMIVGCAGERFAISQSSIAELVRVTESEREQKIGMLQGVEVLRLRGALLPLVRLERALGLQRGAENSQPARCESVLVIETGQLRYALLVDSIYDNEEIVVKPLGRHVRDLGYVAGATILGDGHVALILDAVGIAMKCSLRNTEPSATDLDESTTRSEELHRFLLFANHPSEQFAVPLAMVARIEQIGIRDIQVVGSQNIVVYRGQALPVLRLEQQIGALPWQPDRQYAYMIIFRVHNREIGLIAPVLRDFCDVQMKIDAQTLREPGVLGTLIVDGIPSRVLDLVELIRIKYPNWMELEQTSTSMESKQASTILLAEDSEFFRNHVSRTLEGEGFKVITAFDGQDAWEHLQSVLDDIDLIITDIEMPRMTGLQLAQAVRSREATADLPIIALTSLAGDDDKERGVKAGINEYQVKMDPNRLIDAVRRLAITKTSVVACL